VAKVAQAETFKGTPGQIRQQRIERTGALSLSIIAAVWMIANQ